MAMQDAIALSNGLISRPNDLTSAFADFERSRRQHSSTFQTAAARSLDWYENVADKLHLDPVAFTVDYMCRTGQVDLEDLRNRDPFLVDAYEKGSTAHVEASVAR